MFGDEFVGLHDRVETEPAELTDLFIKFITSALSKKIATDDGLPWNQAHETAHQEKISALVGAAKQRGLASITVIAVKPDGRRAARDISVDTISKDRVLQ
jgi:hypothetical protein